MENKYIYELYENVKDAQEHRNVKASLKLDFDNTELVQFNKSIYYHIHSYIDADNFDGGRKIRVFVQK